MTGKSAFFYGTLMHPLILKRVIGNDGSHLKICPAVLLDHTRHHVCNESYPGVVPYSQSEKYFEKRLDLEDRSVRGSLVTGLNDHDMKLLDYFEGDEYIIEKVEVYPLSELIPLETYTLPDVSADGIVPSKPAALPARLDNAVDAQVYIYRDLANLDWGAGLWTFEDFVRANAWKWIGEEADRQEYLVSVDEFRERTESLASRSRSDTPILP